MDKQLIIWCLCGLWCTSLAGSIDSQNIKSEVRYAPEWSSLDSRPLPEWYDDVKLGVFICIGIYSVPGYGNEWFWKNWKGTNQSKIVQFMKDNYRPNWTYADFASQFTAEFFDADQWSEILEASGAKYIVFTTKHHSGFTNWPSSRSFNWNSMDVGPKRDLVGELGASLRKKTDIHFGLYYSHFEWFNPIYLEDKANGYKTQHYVEAKSMPELYEIVNKYKPEVIFSDGQWEASSEYWNSTNFLAWLYNDSPVKDVVVVNDRWGSDTSCKHGGYFTCQDRYNPGVLKKHKWENAMTIDRASWGFRRDAGLADYLTIEQLLQQLISTVRMHIKFDSCGGNLLMNIAPTKDGRIIPIYEERLRQMGDWLKVNGDSIYKTKPWAHQKDTINSNVWYTSKKSVNGTQVFAITLQWPDDQLMLGSVKPTASTTVQLLGYSGAVSFKSVPSGGLSIILPYISINNMPCQWAWVFQLESVVPS